MRSSASQVLDTALALRQSPGERFRLLGQPLPPGITQIVEIVSGAPQALRDAALELGEPDAVVLEAARFYLEQMLFASPDADAYRILGVSPKAEHELIRLHHRLLQRWLHPDRALAGDASIFATRVNQAWSRLRTPALRAEYDSRLDKTRAASQGTPPPAGPYRWDYEEPQSLQRYGRRSRWLFAAALACSLVLAVLIARHDDDAESMAAWEEAPLTFGEHGAQAAPHPGGELDVPGDALGSHTDVPARAGMKPSAVVPPEPAAEPVRTAVVRLRAPVAARPPLETRVQWPTTTDRARVPRPPSSIQSAHETVDAARSSGEDRAMVLTNRVSAPVAPSPIAAGIAAVSPRAPVAPPMLIATAVSAVLPPPGAPMKAGPDGDPAVLLERMHQAEQRVAQVAAYLAATPGAAPLWNDVRTQVDADRLKRHLAVRLGGTLQLLTPSWQLRPSDANYSGIYRCERCVDDQVRLDVQLVWREGFWLVRGVHLEPAA